MIILHIINVHLSFLHLPSKPSSFLGRICMSLDFILTEIVKKQSQVEIQGIKYCALLFNNRREGGTRK